MGLSIYYRMKAKTDADGARALVERLHGVVKALPFDDVSPIFEYDPPDGRYMFTVAGDDADSRRWKPGAAYLERKRADGKKEIVDVPPLHVVYFAANLKGSETATFGLASHPPVVLHHEDIITTEPGGGETHQIGTGAAIEFPTRLRGWYSWSSCTKTQYAANPKYGGIPNFLRAHLSVFRAIDAAKRIGLKTYIRDDGRYWRYRSESKLVVELAKWDGLVAGIAGKFSDALGNAPGMVVAPIKDRPDFEHLEAKGIQQLKNQQRKSKAKRKGRRTGKTR
jgi:hypothetical protein